MASHAQKQVTPERILQMGWGFAPPLIVKAAIDVKVFDLLDSGPKTVDEISAATGASTRGLTAIMNALVGLELLAKDSAQKYTLTDESAAFLVCSKPSFRGGMFRHLSSQMLPHWLRLTEAVRTGRPPVPVESQAELSHFFEEFVADIFPMSYPAAAAFADAMGVAGANRPVRVLDLAAGSGVWGIALAQRSAQVHVTAVDLPGVTRITREMAQRFGVGDRFDYIEGDLAMVDFGSGHNIATLGHILHAMGASDGRQLLKKTYDATAPGGTIAIAEFLVNDERTSPPGGLIFAVNMLVATEHGNAYSFNEIAGWLTAAGFINPRTLEAPGPSPLILADKPAAR